MLLNVHYYSCISCSYWITIKSKLVSKNTTENDFVIVSNLNVHKVKAHFFYCKSNINIQITPSVFSSLKCTWSFLVSVTCGDLGKHQHKAFCFPVWTGKGFVHYACGGLEKSWAFSLSAGLSSAYCTHLLLTPTFSGPVSKTSWMGIPWKWQKRFYKSFFQCSLSF